MNYQDKYEFIRQWFRDNGLYNKVNVSNEKDLQEFVDVLSPKIPDLYKELRNIGLVKEGSYERFSRMLEQVLNHQIMANRSYYN